MHERGGVPQLDKYQIFYLKLGEPWPNRHLCPLEACSPFGGFYRQQPTEQSKLGYQIVLKVKLDYVSLFYFDMMYL